MSMFDKFFDRLTQQGFRIVSEDRNRPWGGFFAIEEAQAQKFADTYFNGLNTDSLKIAGKLSPKILFVAPMTRLSWQYHRRRAEVWQIVQGNVGIALSDTDTEGEVKQYAPSDMLKINQGQRHRLVGLDDWGIVAEIWQHTDSSNPTDEDDIIRVQDDFGR